MYATTRNEHERSLEWRRKQLSALRRMCEENEDAMVEALKKDLRRCYNTAVTYELWDILRQVGRLVCSSGEPDSNSSTAVVGPLLKAGHVRWVI